MAVVGASYLDHASLAQIAGVGVAANDGWQRVASLRKTELPTSGATDKYAFVIWASIGHIDDFVSAHPSAVFEIAVGDDLTRDFTTICRVKADSPQLRVTAGPRYRSLPFLWVYERTGITHSTWDAGNRSPSIWARFYDPQRQTLLHWHVGNVGILAFALDQFASTSNYEFSRFSTVQALPLGTSFPGSALHSWAPTNFDGSNDWLLFVAHRYWPGQLGTPTFQVRYTSTGAAIDEVPVIGRAGRIGLRERPQAVTGAGPGNLARYSTGSWCVLSSPPAGAAINIYAYDNTAGGIGGGFASWVQDIDLFLVRASVELGDFDYVQLDPPSAFSIYNDREKRPPASHAYQPKEFARLVSSHSVVAWSAAYDPPDDQQRSHSLWLESNVAQGVSRENLLHDLTESRYEGVHGHFGTLLHGLRAAEVQMRFFAVQNIAEPNSANLSRNPMDLCGLHWTWQNAPQGGYTLPAVPPKTVLVPDREGLDVGSLPALPYSPDILLEEDLEDRPRNELEADDGLRITWPRFLTARRSFTLRWPGLTKAERDGLLTALRAAVKWTPPRESSEIALIAAIPPQVGDLGFGHFTVECRFVHLVWLGSGA